MRRTYTSKQARKEKFGEFLKIGIAWLKWRENHYRYKDCKNFLRVGVIILIQEIRKDDKKGW